MRKILGITALLIVVCVITSLASSSFLSAYNLENLIRRTALFGIISIGVAFVIVTGASTSRSDRSSASSAAVSPGSSPPTTGRCPPPWPR